MAKSSSQNRWLQRQKNDPFTNKAKQENFRSRAIYKLEEIHQKDKLFKPGQFVVDLGAAPGSWSQYVVKQVGQTGQVIAVDILPMQALARVEFIQGDFLEQDVVDQCLQMTKGKGVDVVISDIAPNISGIRSSDQAKSMALAEQAFYFAEDALKPGGDFLVKVFEGAGTQEFRQMCKDAFRKVMNRKPQASRDDSREQYVLARSYKL